VIAISRHPDDPLDNHVTPCALDIFDVRVATLDRIGNPDALVHLAWGGLPHYRSMHHLEHELPAHSSFLESCIRAGLRKVLVAGTCLEYGMQSGELSENSACLPVTAYAEAKCGLYRHLSMLRDTHEFSLGWLRLFYLFGPGQAPTSLYAQLRAAVESGATSFDMSAGDQIRDFLAVKEAAAYMAALTMTPLDTDLINICGGKPTTVLDMVRAWLLDWNVDMKLNCGVFPYPDYEPFEFWGNPRRLHTLVGAS
jgi:dTDP-6-deoxy-L-talose 4-dehydrogenase (NAD+)